VTEAADLALSPTDK